jgi:hypothetical protein
MCGIAAKLYRFAIPDGHNPTAGIRAIEGASAPDLCFMDLGHHASRLVDPEVS